MLSWCNWRASGVAVIIRKIRNRWCAVLRWSADSQQMLCTLLSFELLLHLWLYLLQSDWATAVGGYNTWSKSTGDWQGQGCCTAFCFWFLVCRLFFFKMFYSHSQHTNYTRNARKWCAIIRKPGSGLFFPLWCLFCPPPFPLFPFFFFFFGVKFDSRCSRKFSTNSSPSEKIRQAENTTSCHNSGIVNSIGISMVPGGTVQTKIIRTNKDRKERT